MATSSVLPGQSFSMHDSGAETDTEDGSTADVFHGKFSRLYVMLDVTALATDAGDHLDVYVQTTLDGSNWIDIHRFTQQDGTGSAATYVVHLVPATVAEIDISSALAEANSRAILGNSYRLRWDVTDAGTDDASFTFSVTAVGY